MLRECGSRDGGHDGHVHNVLPVIAEEIKRGV